MTSKLVVNTIEADTGISSVSFASSISMSSTSKFHFSNAGIDIGADTNINRASAGVLSFESNGAEKVRINGNGLRVNTTVDNGSGFAAHFHNTGTSNRLQLTTANTGTGQADGAIIMIDSSSNMEILNRENTSLEFFTNNTQRLTLDNTGALRNVNDVRSDFYNGSYDARGLHVEGVGSDRRGWISLVTNHSTSGESVLMFGKTRGTSSNARTIVAANDDLGVVHFSGADGVDLRRAAEVRAQVDGTPAANKVSGRLVFLTTPNTTDASPVERLRITSDGDVAIGRDSAQANYAAGTDTTKLAVAKDAAGSGYHEMAHFAAGSDANDTGSIVRIGHFSNDRGFYIKAGRGTGDNAKAIFGLRTSSAADQDAMTILQGGQLVVGGDTNIAHPNMDDIIIGDASGSRGITIASGTSNYGSLAFGDSTDGSGADRYEGLIEYYHNDDSLTFYTAHTPKFKILSTSNGGALETASKTITGGNNLAIQNFKVKGVWSGSSSIGKSIELISGYDSSVKMAAIGYNLTDTNTGSTYGGDLTFHTQPLYGSPTTPLPVRMRISSVGHVTKPETPCFIVRHTSAEVYNGGSYIDGPWTSTLNRGSHFNTSTGIFTTPVTGLYQLNMMMNNDYASTSRPGNFQIRVNNSLYAGMQFDPLDSHNGWFTHVLTGTLNLTRNDTVRLYTGNNARVDNNNWNHWSMYLIG